MQHRRLLGRLLGKIQVKNWEILLFLGMFLVLQVSCNGEPGETENLPNSQTNEDPIVDPAVDAASRYFFDTVLIPEFNSKCKTCHNLPALGGNAPLSIFSYESSVILAGNGNSSSSNEFVHRTRKQIPHGFSNQCASGMGSPVCQKLAEWWGIRFGAATTANQATLGGINFIDGNAMVSGWAIDPDASTSVVVSFYVDGTNTTGSFIGSATANIPYAVMDFPGNHGFNFNLPTAVKDGMNHLLYAYATDLSTGALTQLKGSPKAFNFFSPTQAGLDYYEATVKPAFQANCSGCHNSASAIMNYISAYSWLASPAPSMGGTATSNLLIRKTANQISHNGGNQCPGGLGSSPCNLIQQWWTIEFQ